MTVIQQVELKGGYTMGNKIIIGVVQIDNTYEVMALYEGGEELDCVRTASEDDAIKIFDDLILKYAEPLQKAVYSTKLEKGKKYTLVYISEFGFPVVEKITFDSMQFTTYAQYSDCVKLIYKPYKKRTMYKKYFYNCSLMIFEGWQDIKEEDTKEVIKDDGSVRITRSKYSCFSSSYIDDIEKILKNPLVIYKNYKKGANNKIYA